MRNMSSRLHNEGTRILDILKRRIGVQSISIFQSIAAILLALCALDNKSSHALEFEIRRIGPQESGGHIFEVFDAIFAKGAIKAGDSLIFEQLAKRAGRDMYGNIALVLDSTGGSVAEAFKMVEVMDREEVSVYVPPGAKCASACASIIYVSGRFHVVMPGGYLGFHTCSLTVSGILNPSSICNKEITRNAIAHGSSFAAVATWLDESIDKYEKNKNSELLWIGENVACNFGLCGPPVFNKILAIPSFDCSSSRIDAERLICTDRQLARYDREISLIYFKIIRRNPDNSRIQRIKDAQRSWLRHRNSCENNRECILNLMKQRLLELTAPGL